jgi:hypothetical protein
LFTGNVTAAVGGTASTVVTDVEAGALLIQGELPTSENTSYV